MGFERPAPPPRMQSPPPTRVGRAGPAVLLATRERTHADDARAAGFWQGALLASVGWLAAWFLLSEVRTEEVARVLERGAIMSRAMEKADVLTLNEASPVRGDRQ